MTYKLRCILSIVSEQWSIVGISSVVLGLSHGRSHGHPRDNIAHAPSYCTTRESPRKLFFFLSLLSRTIKLSDLTVGVEHTTCGLSTITKQKDFFASSMWFPSYRADTQYTRRKKMAAVHFTTIPCEPNTANRHKERQFFANPSLY